jgi:hypothetical protein
MDTASVHGQRVQSGSKITFVRYQEPRFGRKTLSMYTPEALGFWSVVETGFVPIGINCLGLLGYGT